MPDYRHRNSMKEWFKILLSKLLGNGFLILLIVAVLYILWLRECKRPELCPPDGNVLIAQSEWDSIAAMLDKPPTVHIDTVYLKGDPVYVPATPLPPPKPDPKDSTINNYSDSLVNKEIDVRYKFKVQGTLIDRTWSYRPIQTVIHEIDSIPYPKIVEVDRPVKVSQRGLYAYGIAGGNSKAFLFGGGLDFITKKSTEIGYMYQRFGTENFHSVKIGAKLFNKQ